MKYSGIGISHDDQKRIFDLFEQVSQGSSKKYKGSGVGLYLCKHLAHVMKGEIWVESQVRKGSIFKFTLPLKPVKNIESRFTEIDIFGLDMKDIDEEIDNVKKHKMIINR